MTVRGMALAWLLVAGLARPLAALMPVPNPPENVLIIYVNDGAYDTSLYNAFAAALGALTPAPTITPLPIPPGTIGIYSTLLSVTGHSDLSPYCQVWDLRFLAGNDNIAYTGPNQSDVITFTGANNDTQLFEQYLNANGHLFLQGEHHDYYIRDLNLIALVDAVATAPITEQYAEYSSMNPGSITGWSTTIETINNLATTVNTTNPGGGNGYINADFPGGLDVGSAGSALPIGATFPGSIYGGTANTAWYWPSSSLSTTGGEMVVNWETNAFCTGSLLNNTSNAWIQNVYGLLSGCYRYSLTKAFNQSPLCVGANSFFTLCYTNSGSTALTNVPLWDTLPACLIYGSDSLGGATVNGQVYSWTIPTVNPGTSQCVTVNFTVGPYGACP